MTETRIRVKTTLGVTDHNLLDNRFEDNQHTINAISGLQEALESKQDILTAGDNIEIDEEGVISAVNTTYSAGDNIEIDEEGVISATYSAGDNVTISEEGVISAVDTTYSAGNNISIDNGVISAADTTYSAGDNISINNGVISAVDTTYSAGNNISIDNGVISATYSAGNNISIDNGVISAIDTTYSAGNNISINNGVISAIDTTYSAGNNVSIDNGVISAVDTTYSAGSGISIDDGVISNTRTANDGILTIQKNGTTVDTFTANSSANKTINLIIPTTAGDVSALPDTTKYASSISVSINSSDFKVTTTLKDQNGDTLGSAQVIDLPLESVVVSGSYDSTNKNVVLTLQNGSDITFSVADLVSGLQSEITSNNKLDADLVDDTTSVNKFVTASDKTTWNGKQDAISDLATIRSGANLGATSVQSVISGTANGTISVDSTDVAVTGLGSAAFTSSSAYATAAQGALADTAIQSSDLQMALNAKQDMLTAGSNITISGSTISATDTTYTAGDNISITNGAISATYTAGDNISITNGAISATYTAGANITITNGEISSTGTTYTAGTGIDIANDVISVDGQTTTEVTLATVATSGDYTDLSNKPTIPAAQVNSDWNAISGVAQILNKPTIPTVDQTYDGTSSNAQSGVAIAGVLGNIETLLHNLNSGS